MLLVEQQGAVTIVTLDRPEALNALNGAMLLELGDAFLSIAGDSSVHAVVLTGSGRAFVAGADIAEMAHCSEEQALAYAQKGHQVMDQIAHCPQPVIAAINGFCLGGGLELALACDIRLAADTATFAQPEVSLGIIPGFSGTERLPKAVGVAQALDWICTGRRFTAVEAKDAGLVQAIYPADALLSEAVKRAQMIAEQPSGAVRAAKEAVVHGGEILKFASCFATKDQQDRMAAFLTKRKKG